ncbi:Divalent metal cation transporter MntH [Apilactobacillus kunkeei]|uniref:NRAMP family divalent metal transporter n=1 Tax=Apilactobacillus kunkeei TaxID=148814 RepID=UPI0021648BB5|nr:divalent metal cation transporter [Apilactobacillus kunkeei]CAI2647077.1 Divalent metal cation transporter MntH [Apilactobacillus kunkeei]CAI2649685.1 Divalent metal cation transporter MntH [Apilactobacillus kunkeei]CAI2651686.1 Divalent metal cation transporter MntH [Apilactobacillus kunkeei]CAI2652000.1 Divalent metal cation transporter MntH [Apilactobacillus kunkeei]CAI2654063.1 Divalent metal cation transporter MntH [Apilactobacillus kunkeei]
MKEIIDSEINDTSSNRLKGFWLELKKWLIVIGPGLIVMLADTDAGCLITAAQSGASYGYSMILPQLLLIPILFMVQEMTVRLGIVTKKGHGELIREYFGKFWAYVSAITLMISTIGALLTEFIGIAGVGELFGISKWITVPLSTFVLILIAFLGSYRRVEKIGIIFGLFELTFIIGIFMVHPNMDSIMTGIQSIPIHDDGYVYLVAANVGAVIMPWMIFYQQSAVVDKGLKRHMIKKEQTDTMVGTFITQGIMIGFIVLFAATVFHSKLNATEETVGDLVTSIGRYIGMAPAKAIMGSSILGGALVAAIVVVLAGTWGMTEVLDWKHSLNERINRSNLGFYSMYSLVLIVSALLVLFNEDLVSIAITVEVINALMVPIVLGFLLMLETKELPDRYKMKGIYKKIVIILSLIVMVFGIYMIFPVLNL